MAGGHDQAHLASLSRGHDGLREMSQPHVRPDFTEGILSDARDLRAAPGSHGPRPGPNEHCARRPGACLRYRDERAHLRLHSRRRAQAGH